MDWENFVPFCYWKDLKFVEKDYKFGQFWGALQTHGHLKPVHHGGLWPESTLWSDFKVFLQI